MDAMRGFKGAAVRVFLMVRFRGRCSIDPGARLGSVRLVFCDSKSSIAVGARTTVSASSSLGARDGGSLTIGEGVFINRNCVIGAAERIEIGDFAAIGPGVVIVDTAKDQAARIRDEVRRDVSRPVVIESYAWIGANCSILPGVRVGRGAIVGAGSVVTRDIPAARVAAGVPARVVGLVGEE